MPRVTRIRMLPLLAVVIDPEIFPALGQGGVILARAGQRILDPEAIDQQLPARRAIGWRLKDALEQLSQLRFRPDAVAVGWFFSGEHIEDQASHRPDVVALADVAGDPVRALFGRRPRQGAHDLAWRAEDGRVQESGDLDGAGVFIPADGVWIDVAMGYAGHSQPAQSGQQADLETAAIRREQLASHLADRYATVRLEQDERLGHGRVVADQPADLGGIPVNPGKPVQLQPS